MYGAEGTGQLVEFYYLVADIACTACSAVIEGMEPFIRNRKTKVKITSDSIVIGFGQNVSRIQITS